ncbi:uncharacterized protein [Mycetomoellerius zeteki]|uniref:uncharacterized protein n=1 Tax=Mycetomoellerius zeteki TaxID=64791 RepID=UPI00084ECF45|nr:PREDICTED: uncharacterized protein LOC108729518 [Trachymyrmex zeteki]
MLYDLTSSILGQLTKRKGLVNFTEVVDEWFTIIAEMPTITTIFEIKDQCSALDAHFGLIPASDPHYHSSLSGRAVDRSLMRIPGRLQHAISATGRRPGATDGNTSTSPCPCDLVVGSVPTIL